MGLPNVRRFSHRELLSIGQQKLRPETQHTQSVYFLFTVSWDRGVPVHIVGLPRPLDQGAPPPQGSEGGSIPPHTLLRSEAPALGCFPRLVGFLQVLAFN